MTLAVWGTIQGCRTTGQCRTREPLSESGASQLERRQAIVPSSALMLFLCAAPVIWADQNSSSCRTSSLNGSFGYTVTGTINAGAVPALPPGPFAAVGRINFSGNGAVNTVRTLSANGTVIRADSGSGNYIVNADCTGIFSISIATPGGTVNLDLDFVLANRNNELRAIVTNPGYIFNLSGTKQSSND